MLPIVLMATITHFTTYFIRSWLRAGEQVSERAQRGTRDRVTDRQTEKRKQRKYKVALIQEGWSKRVHFFFFFLASFSLVKLGILIGVGVVYLGGGLWGSEKIELLFANVQRFRSFHALVVFFPFSISSLSSLRFAKHETFVLLYLWIRISYTRYSYRGIDVARRTFFSPFEFVSFSRHGVSQRDSPLSFLSTTGSSLSSLFFPFSI